MSEKITINDIDFEVDKQCADNLLREFCGSASIKVESEEARTLVRDCFFENTKVTVMVRDRELEGYISQLMEVGGVFIEFDLTVDLGWEEMALMLKRNQ